MKLIMKRLDNMYVSPHNESRKPNYLSTLSSIFNEGNSWTECVKNKLLDSNSKGISGNKTKVVIENNNVIIKPLFAEEPEYWAIEIDRNILLKLIIEWQKLAAQGSREIAFTRNEDVIITIDGNE